MISADTPPNLDDSGKPASVNNCTLIVNIQLSKDMSWPSRARRAAGGGGLTFSKEEGVTQTGLCPPPPLWTEEVFYHHQIMHNYVHAVYPPYCDHKLITSSEVSKIAGFCTDLRKTPSPPPLFQHNNTVRWSSFNTVHAFTQPFTQTSE